jgi:hypothetical protein
MSASDLWSLADHLDSLKAAPLAIAGTLLRLVEGRVRKASKTMVVCPVSFMPDKQALAQ